MKKELFVPSLMTAVFMVLVSALPGYADPPLPTIPGNTFTITSFGALGDGVSNNAAAIQNTINAAAAAGGGTVVVAAVGVLTNYLSGPFNLTNNVSLQINSNAVLRMQPMSIWFSNYGTTTFINGSKLHDVEINGLGTIDGQGTNWWFPLASSRPNMINFSGCSNVLIQGVTLQNPPTFHIMVKGNNINLTIQGITENTPFDSHNTDGMDLASTNVLIRNCTISVGDDNIEIGGSGGAAANITVSNCVFGSGHGVSIGSLIATQLVSDVRGVHDLIVSNCSFSGTDNGIRMKTDRDRGGVCQNLKYLDITMTNVANPIIIYGYYDSIGTPTNITPFQASTDTVQTVTGSTPVWRNITISNLTASADSGRGVVGTLWGVPEMLISNVTFYNVHFSAPKTFCIYNAQAIRIIDSQIAAPSGTNTLTLYNVDITVTNSTANTNLVTLGGLAAPPTNNTLAFFNAQAAVTDSNMLGAGPITLGGSTLTFNQGPVSFSNNVNTVSASTLVFSNGTATMGGGLSGPGPLAVVLTNTGNLRFNQGVNPWGGTNAAFDGGASGVINNHSAGNITILLGALSGGSGSSLRGSDQAGAGTDTYVVGSLNTNTTFAGSITNGAQHTVALVKIGSGTFAITGTNGYTGGTTLSNGTLAISNPLGQGTLTVAGGTNTISSTLTAGDGAGTTGAVWVTGGRLDAGIQTILLGSSGVGQMTVSNGTVAAGVVNCGFNSGSRGTLTIAGGTTTPLSLTAGLNGATGTVWVTGGQLGPVGGMQIGRSGKGQMTVSNGTVLSSANVILGVGIFSMSQGSLTVVGGSVAVTNGAGTAALIVGQADPGVYSQNAGVVTVDNLLATNLANSVFTFSGGTFQTKATTVSNTQQFAFGNGPLAATYHLLGGTHAFNNGLRVHNSATLSGCGTVTAVVVVDAGGTVVADCGGLLTFNGSVTNNGTMQAINGSVLESYGPVINNGLIDITGGTTNFHSTFVNNGSIVGGPVPAFQISSIVPQGSNILVTWATSAGKTNELQVTSGGPGGSYNTNSFVAIFGVTNAVGSSTNYLDIGGATNKPARYYRVRLVP